MNSSNITEAGWTAPGPRGTVTAQFEPAAIFVDVTGRIYLADSGNNQIVRMSDMMGTGRITLGTVGSGVKQFSQPAGIFVDGAGRIYVADWNNDRIVRINDMTGAGWTTLGTTGSGVNQFSGPAGIFVDGAGRIYIADSLNNRIVRVSDMTGAGWKTLSMQSYPCASSRTDARK